MIIRSLMAATLVLCGSLAFAQTCGVVTAPGSVCLVPSRTSTVTTYTAPAATSTTVVLPYSGATTAVVANPVVAGTQQAVCLVPASPCAGAGADAACINSQIRVLQGTVRAAAIASHGQQLIAQMNKLQSEEAAFRQLIAANPNMPGGQALALAMQAQSETLARDLADFNRELSLIPVDQRPFMAADLNTFTTAYWDPAMTNFAAYRIQFASSGPAYQPAVAANPWLTPWQTVFSTNLSNIAMLQPQFASVNWWSNMRVAGAMEALPSGAIMMPNGVIYIPASSILTPAGTAAAVAPTGTVGTTVPTTGGAAY